ncbi:hypothetical protein M011DRAFT_529553 [Sporormia fimetaria CBS 119925]|uniref:Uncharacterized protein n=1 Tax=Sporormia fimetaria CBS 119925 TaxID=1340428 RepID=A0A6A6V0K4_9PLEO|nr:hypothetical protein M011DRAFT_529553 [Sporormia fimetaria CBS 119925]
MISFYDADAKETDWHALRLVNRATKAELEAVVLKTTQKRLQLLKSSNHPLYSHLVERPLLTIRDTQRLRLRIKRSNLWRPFVAPPPPGSTTNLAFFDPLDPRMTNDLLPSSIRIVELDISRSVDGWQARVFEQKVFRYLALKYRGVRKIELVSGAREYELPRTVLYDEAVIRGRCNHGPVIMGQ